jgi:hypothetical protein
MPILLQVLRELTPFIFLIFITILIEFQIKYRLLLGIENFYIGGIRIVILMIIAIRLNEYGGIYSYISFVITYVICVILDKRYRMKIEECWGIGTDSINKYVTKNKKITLRRLIKFRIRPFIEKYKETYNIFIFKLNALITLCFILYLLYIVFK